MSKSMEGKSTVGVKNNMMKVLVPTDESSESLYALRWTLGHFFNTSTQSGLDAEGQDPNTVTLVHVKTAFRPFIYPAGPVIDGVQKAQENIAAAVLSRALNICKQHKIKAETLILEGDPKERICDAAEQLRVDCVVLGSHGLGAIKRAFLGSVSDYCAHYLSCPVLIVKAPPKVAAQ